MRYDKKFYNTPIAEPDPTFTRITDARFVNFRMEGVLPQVFRGTILHYTPKGLEDLIHRTIQHQRELEIKGPLPREKSPARVHRDSQTRGNFSIIVCSRPAIYMYALRVLDTPHHGYSYINRVDGGYHLFENYS